jgi:predicted glutamine amidotransferase
VVRRVLQAAEAAGVAPFRLTAAFSDGHSLHAVRYATDAYAPTLYAAQPRQGGGFRLVSEPLDGQGCNWQAVPPGSFVTVNGSGLSITPFAPEGPRLALSA